MSEGYNPNNSKTDPAKLGEFIRRPITGNLAEDAIPCCGPATIAALKDNNITTTFQLIGHFMLLKEEGVGPIEHCDRFFYWLKSIQPQGNNSLKSAIVEAIAQKVNTMFPGIYDEGAYGDQA